MTLEILISALPHGSQKLGVHGAGWLFFPLWAPPCSHPVMLTIHSLIHHLVALSKTSLIPSWPRSPQFPASSIQLMIRLSMILTDNPIEYITSGMFYWLMCTYTADAHRVPGIWWLGIELGCPRWTVSPLRSGQGFARPSPGSDPRNPLGWRYIRSYPKWNIAHVCNVWV